MSYIFKKLFHFFMVFYSRAFFDAAAYIDSINAELNCLDDVAGIDAAGQEYAFIDIADDIPVEAKSRAAVFIRVERVEQDSVGEIPLDLFNVPVIFDTNRLYRAQVQRFERIAKSRFFIAVQL